MVAGILSIEHRLNMDKASKEQFIDEQWCFCPYCEAKTKPIEINYKLKPQPIIVVACAECLTVWGVK